MGVPGVAQLADAFHSRRPAERLFLVYEHHGTSLNELLAKGWPQHLALIKAVARGVLQGLQALHLAGFLHTDIKPQNILVQMLDWQPASGHEPGGGHQALLGDLPPCRVMVGDLGSIEEASASSVARNNRGRLIHRIWGQIIRGEVSFSTAGITTGFSPHCFNRTPIYRKGVGGLFLVGQCVVQCHGSLLDWRSTGQSQCLRYIS